MRIETKGLTKIYKGGIIGIENVTLTTENSMFGLLGPNGAGKTTLMRILATLMEPTHGEIYIDGMNLHEENSKNEIKRILGYLPEEFGTYPELTGYEFLDYMGILCLMKDKRERMRKVKELLETVGLEEAETRKTRTYSKGMKQRLGIAQALLNDPQLLIVDEPTSGLDPEERIKFRNLLSELSGDRIVVLATHIVGDVEHACNDMAIIDKGKILERGSPRALIQSVKSKVWEAEIDSAQTNEVRKTHRVISLSPTDNGYRVRFLADEPVVTAEKVNPTLEDAYIYRLHHEP
jgi:ABC-2 type transport system ATP-binding protein